MFPSCPAAEATPSIVLAAVGGTVIVPEASTDTGRGPESIIIKIAKSRVSRGAAITFPCTGGLFYGRARPGLPVTSRSGKFAPRGEAETDADENCRGAAEATPGPRYAVEAVR